MLSASAPMPYVDCDTELINKDLKKWRPIEEMEIQLTTPYTPSQNSVAECMNRRPVELEHAISIASKLSEVLWKPAVDVAHVRNRTYTTTFIEGQTIYQGWYGTKPKVSHLYGSSSKGRISPEKSFPSLSTRLCQITYNDACKSVLYYKDTSGSLKQITDCRQVVTGGF